MNFFILTFIDGHPFHLIARIPKILKSAPVKTAVLLSLLTSSFWGLIPLSYAQNSNKSVAIGLGYIEETDDRMKGIWGLLVQLPLIDVRYYTRSNEYGPVEEITQLLSVSKSFTLTQLYSINASLGGVVLEESSRIHYNHGEAENYKEVAYNLGVHFGLSAVLFNRGDFFTTINWDSSLFPAGLDGAIFLAFGRKQILSLALGMNL